MITLSYTKTSTVSNRVFCILVYLGQNEGHGLPAHTLHFSLSRTCAYQQVFNPFPVTSVITQRSA